MVYPGAADSVYGRKVLLNQCVSWQVHVFAEKLKSEHPESWHSIAHRNILHGISCTSLSGLLIFISVFSIDPNVAWKCELGTGPEKHNQDITQKVYLHMFLMVLSFIFRKLISILYLYSHIYVYMYIFMLFSTQGLL